MFPTHLDLDSGPDSNIEVGEDAWYICSQLRFCVHGANGNWGENQRPEHSSSHPRLTPNAAPVIAHQAGLHHQSQPQRPPKFGRRHASAGTRGSHVLRGQLQGHLQLQAALRKFRGVLPHQGMDGGGAQLLLFLSYIVI